MKEKFIENGIEYVRNGDYYITNLTMPDDKVYNIGKYGRMHERFIKKNRPCFYSMKMLNGTWLAYLEEIDTSAKEMVDRLIKDINPDVEYMKDPIYRDIPSVDNSLFILARELILESK